MNNLTVNAKQVRYRVEAIEATAKALADWTLSRADDTARGECPHCHDEMEYEFDPTEIALSVGEEEAAEEDATGAPRKIECRCSVPHNDDHGKAQRGCGRYWHVRVMPEGHEPQIIPETERSLKRLADELANTDRKAQEEKVRAAADKWVGGVTALLGLLGLSGIAFGKDALAGLTTEWRWVLSIALVVAVCAAALAVLYIYRAAYGWPREVDVSNVAGLKYWYQERRAALGKAAADLRKGVYLALAAVVALCVGAGAAIWSSAQPRTPLVEMTRADDSKVCGELLDSTGADKLRIRRVDGSVETLDGIKVTKVSTVPKCGG